MRVTYTIHNYAGTGLSKTVTINDRQHAQAVSILKSRYGDDLHHKIGEHLPELGITITAVERNFMVRTLLNGTHLIQAPSAIIARAGAPLARGGRDQVIEVVEVA